MKCTFSLRLVAGLLATAGFGVGCTGPQATALPPARTVVPARSPAEVLQALPGVWVIDVEASASAMARAQFQPRQVTVLRRESDARETRETTTVADRFDAKAYRDARRYWLDLLKQPDMQWQLTFHADGSGVHRAIIQTGQPPVDTPFTWQLTGWRLHLAYPANAHFQSFDTEMVSAAELNYPMPPLGDHLVLQRVPR